MADCKVYISGFQKQDNSSLFICFFCVIFVFLLMIILMMSKSYFWMFLMKSLVFLSFQDRRGGNAPNSPPGWFLLTGMFQTLLGQEALRKIRLWSHSLCMWNMISICMDSELDNTWGLFLANQRTNTMNIYILRKSRPFIRIIHIQYLLNKHRKVESILVYSSQTQGLKNF